MRKRRKYRDLPFWPEHRSRRYCPGCLDLCTAEYCDRCTQHIRRSEAAWQEMNEWRSLQARADEMEREAAA